MARLDPLLIVAPLERQLKRVEIGRRLDLPQAIETPAMHEIGADQSGKDERPFGGVLRVLGETEQQKGDHRDGDLDSHFMFGMFGGAEKAADFEGLLDPAELDRPAPPVERGDLYGRSIEVVGENAQHLAGIELDANLAYRILQSRAPIFSMIRLLGTSKVYKRLLPFVILSYFLAYIDEVAPIKGAKGGPEGSSRHIEIAAHRPDQCEVCRADTSIRSSPLSRHPDRLSAVVKGDAGFD
jgi:hypothetical protein